MTPRNARLPFRPSALTQPRAAPPDSATVSVEVSTATGRGTPQPVAGATVLACATNGQVPTAASCDSIGRATLQTTQAQRPHHFTVSAIGYLSFEQPWPRTNTAFKLALQPNLGTLLPASTRYQYRVLRLTPTQLVLLSGPDTTTLVLRTP